MLAPNCPSSMISFSCTVQSLVFWLANKVCYAFEKFVNKLMLQLPRKCMNCIYCFETCMPIISSGLKNNSRKMLFLFFLHVFRHVSTCGWPIISMLYNWPTCAAVIQWKLATSLSCLLNATKVARKRWLCCVALAVLNASIMLGSLHIPSAQLFPFSWDLSTKRGYEHLFICNMTLEWGL